MLRFQGFYLTPPNKKVRAISNIGKTAVGGAEAEVPHRSDLELRKSRFTLPSLIESFSELRNPFRFVFCAKFRSFRVLSIFDHFGRYLTWISGDFGL